ncbi:MAG: RNA methyltransferase, partial [Caedimonadaceae bacterium]
MIRQNPVIILDQPQLPRNIGMVARAMLNFELSELRLISPPLGWYNENTIALSAGADQVLAHAKTFDSLDDCAHD